MSARRALLVLIVSFGALIFLLGATAGAQPLDSNGDVGREPADVWPFQGRVFQGNLGDESTPIPGVTVSLYGSNDGGYPDPGQFIMSTTTDASGWYSLPHEDSDLLVEIYHLIETDLPGYNSVTATTVSGEVTNSNWIQFDATDDPELLDLSGNKFWDQEVRATWDKWVGGLEWESGFQIELEMGDAFAVVDVITPLPAESVVLFEEWNPDHLNLSDYQIEPEGVGVITTTGSMELNFPEGGTPYTVTKFFLIQPCTWEATLLSETLWRGVEMMDEKSATVFKTPPDLWISSTNNLPVYPGDVATFTLTYGNWGGYENDVVITNTFPITAPFVDANPAPDYVADDGIWVEWHVGDLSRDSEGVIDVWVGINESVVPFSMVTIWDGIFNHVRELAADTLVEYQVVEPPEIEWQKWVNGEIWSQDLVVPIQTGDFITVVDILANRPVAATLFEFWAPEHLALHSFLVDPGGSDVDPGDGQLIWNVPPGAEPYTLIKVFEVLPSTWAETWIEEYLFVEGVPDPMARLVRTEKWLPELQLESVYESPVTVGEPAAFTLVYSNAGGRESTGMIRNEFPEQALFMNSSPPPSSFDLAGGRWAEWTLPEPFEHGQVESIDVTVGIAPDLLPWTTIPIWDGIINHAGELVDEAITVFHVPPPPVVFPEGDWPWYAQGEITVHPEPPVAGQPTELCAEVVNTSDESQGVVIEFSVADFGIGMPFEPVGEAELLVPPGEHRVGCIIWVPPSPQHWCIQARLMGPGYPLVISQRNVDVDEPLTAGVSHSRVFPVRNPFGHPVTISLGLIPHLPGWGLELSQDTVIALEAGTSVPITLTVTSPDGEPMPPDGHPIVDVEAYVGDDLIGGFRKIYRPPVILHRFPDPIYAEREISIHPYPLQAGEPAEFCVDLRNPTDESQDAIVHFAWSFLGIELPFYPINGPRPVHLPPFSVVRECIYWIPPVSGELCLQVELEMEGHAPQRSRRNLDVSEVLVAGVPHSRMFFVGNPADQPVTVTLGLVPHVATDLGWDFDISPDTLTSLGVTETRPVTLTVTPADQPMPPDGTPIVDLEAYVDGQLFGGIRKLYRPPIQLHRLPDPVYAEGELSVHPYPPRAGEPTEVCVELRNPTPVPHDVGVQFAWAHFGIGLPFTPINGLRPVHLPPHSIVRECIHWIPPIGGELCVQAELLVPGQEVQSSRRNMDVSEPLEPGVRHDRVFLVGNPYDHPITVTMGLVPHLPGWSIDLSHDVLFNLEPTRTQEVTLSVTPPEDMPEDGQPIVDVEAYVEHELLGGFRKVYRPPVPIHRPRDPVYAESEIGVDPYPVIPGQPVELSVEVFNPTPVDRVVTATFSIADFGIGLPFSTSHITPNPIRIFVPAHGAARGHVIWQPPDWGGKFCVQVTLDMDGHESIWSRRNIDVGEPLRPGEPHSLDFLVGAWPNTEPVTITMGLIRHRDDIEASLSHEILIGVAPDEPVTVTLTVTPTENAELATGTPVVDVEAFVDGELLGGFRKLDIPPIPIHKPHEKSYAESEINIEPYPPQLGTESLVSTILQNTSDVTATVDLEFGWARFGMGIPFTSTGMLPYTRSVDLGPMLTTTAAVTWTPTYSGHQCVLVKLTDPEGELEEQWSQRNVDVEERPPCGQTKVFTFTVYNDSPLTVTVDIGMITFNVPADWEVTVTPSDTLPLGPLSEGVVTVTVKIPCPSTVRALRALDEIAAIQEASGSVPIIDVEGYVDGELVGGIELQLPAPAPRKLYLPLIMH